MKIFEILAENNDDNVYRSFMAKRQQQIQNKIISDYQSILRGYFKKLENFRFDTTQSGIKGIGGFENVYDLDTVLLQNKEFRDLSVKRSNTVSAIEWIKNLQQSDTAFYNRLITFAYPEKLKAVSKILNEFLEEISSFIVNNQEHDRVIFANALDQLSVTPIEKIKEIERSIRRLEILGNAIQSVQNK